MGVRGFFIWPFLLSFVDVKEKVIQVFPQRKRYPVFNMPQGFQINLKASEPLVSDLVDVEIDENGLLYAVERHRYPLDRNGSGKVKVLQDEDGDGGMDGSETFAEDLKFPTGVMRWKKRILVTDPPNVCILRIWTEMGYRMVGIPY